MKANDLFGRKFVNRSDFCEVGAKLAAITDRYFAQMRFGEFYFTQAPETRSQLRFDISMGGFQRVKLHQHGAVGRMKVHDAIEWFSFQQFKKGDDFAVSIERNSVPEMNEERLIAGGLKPNICGKQILHRAESISHGA